KTPTQMTRATTVGTTSQKTGKAGIVVTRTRPLPLARANGRRVRPRNIPNPNAITALCQGGLRGYRAPVGEAAGIVAAEAAVLEHAPAFGAVAGGTGHVVDDAERGA